MGASLISTVPIQATWWHKFAYTWLYSHRLSELRSVEASTATKQHTHTYTHKTDVVVGGDYNCLYTKWTMIITQNSLPGTDISTKLPKVNAITYNIFMTLYI